MTPGLDRATWRRNAARRGAVALFGFGVAVPGTGSTATAQSGQADWSHSVTVYGWFTSLSATIGTRLGDVEIEQDVSDIFEQLQFAAFAGFESRVGRWGIIGDFAYADLSETSSFERPLASKLFGEATIDTTLTAASAYAAYRLAETPALAFDVAAGLRYYDLSVDASVSGGRLRALGLSRNETWIDPLVGARATWRPAARWRVTGALDAGGFGIGDASDLSWQAVAEVDYAVTERWSAVAGYRHLFVDRPLPERDFDLVISGPTLGVRARF